MDSGHPAAGREQGNEPRAAGFEVRAAGDDLSFAAAHFLVLTDGDCEPLHGHNYRVTAQVQGLLDADHYVVDFLLLVDRLKAVLGELDHAVLLPQGHPSIGITESETEIEVRVGQRRWVLPRADCRLLPIPATTAERLAEHIGRRLWEELLPRVGRPPQRLRIEIEETPGCWAAAKMTGGA